MGKILRILSTPSETVCGQRRGAISGEHTRPRVWFATPRPRTLVKDLRRGDASNCSRGGRAPHFELIPELALSRRPVASEPRGDGNRMKAEAKTDQLWRTSNLLAIYRSWGSKDWIHPRTP